jgi:hypothetical protein
VKQGFGATEVATWEVLAVPRPSQLESVESFPRDGFETSMLVQTSDPFVAVPAKDRFGQALGTSAPVKLLITQAAPATVLT